MKQKDVIISIPEGVPNPHLLLESVSGCKPRALFSYVYYTAGPEGSKGEQKYFSEVFMDWWIWAVIIGAAIFLVVDWFIVMGADPRRWKGGRK